MSIMNRSRNLAIVLVTVLLPYTLGATEVRAGEFSNGVGSGIQYGGIVGWQGGYISGPNRTRISFGYAGFAIGYDRYFWHNTSIGLQVFANQYRIGSGLNVNYDVDGNPKKGLVVGLDLYSGYDSSEYLGEFYWEYIFDPEGLRELDTRSRRGAFISVGYHF